MTDGIEEPYYIRLLPIVIDRLINIMGEGEYRRFYRRNLRGCNPFEMFERAENYLIFLEKSEGKND